MKRDTSDLTPSKIIQIATSFRIAKVLLSAIELEVFTRLSKKRMALVELIKVLGVQGRGTEDFLDTLVSLKLLEKNKDFYLNTDISERYLVKGRVEYIGGLMDMYNGRLYNYWGNLTTALKTGKPQNEIKGGQDLFDSLKADPKRLKMFMLGMSGVSLPVASALANILDLRKYKNIADIGTAQGVTLIQLLLKNPHLKGIGFDLPEVETIFNEYISGFQINNKPDYIGGNFFTDDLPQADVLILGHVLSDWSLSEKKTLLKKAYKALPKGGMLTIYDLMIDNERRNNTAALLMSLNMLIDTTKGFNYTRNEINKWLEEAGFKNIRFQTLIGADSLITAIK